MSKVNQLRQKFEVDMESLCIEDNVDFNSLKNLLTAEKTKKFLKKTARIQEHIDREIENKLGNENK